MIMLTGENSEAIANSTEFLQRSFHREIDDGLIQIIVPPDSYYAKLRNTSCVESSASPPCSYQMY